jgi:hypothetical protein
MLPESQKVPRFDAEDPGMGKASKSKAVRRASGASKKAMRGQRKAWGFYGLIAVIVAAGVGGIALARGGTTDTGGAHPNLQDHWHTAYAVDICGVVQPNLPQPDQLIGVHTHTDGLIHVEPFVTGSILDRGDHVTLARFVDGEPGFKLTSGEVQMPGGKAMKNGDDCDGKPGQLTIRQWPDAGSDEFTDYTDPADVKITDQGAVTIAFVPAGTDIAKPATIANLANPNAGEGAGNMPPVPTDDTNG